MPIPKTATTGNVGSTTHVAPLFPLVGGLGNPLIGFMAYRCPSTTIYDFADNQQVYVSIYGVQHTYITFLAASTGLLGNSVSAGLMVRFD